MPSLAGKFLVARPLLKDPNFRQTVVLLLQHGAEGAFGLIVNRPGKSKNLPFDVFRGGPCASDGLLMLHGHPEWVNDTGEGPGPGVAPGIFLGDAGCLTRVEDLEADSRRFRMFSGYSGWGPDQLEGELASGAWAIMPATGELIFETPPKELWDRLSPPTIPQPSLN